MHAIPFLFSFSFWEVHDSKNNYIFIECKVCILTFELPLCKQNRLLWRFRLGFCRIHAQFAVKLYSYLEIGELLSQGNVPNSESPILMKFGINVVFKKFFLIYNGRYWRDGNCPQSWRCETYFVKHIPRKLLKISFLCKLPFKSFCEKSFCLNNIFKKTVFLMSFSK